MAADKRTDIIMNICYGRLVDGSLSGLNSVDCPVNEILSIHPKSWINNKHSHVILNQSFFFLCYIYPVPLCHRINNITITSDEGSGGWGNYARKAQKKRRLAIIAVIACRIILLPDKYYVSWLLEDC